MALPAQDAFTSNTESPLVTNWSTGTVGLFSDGCKGISNGAAARTGAALCASYWDADSFDDDQYAQVTVLDNTGYAGVMLRHDTAKDDAYIFFVRDVNRIRIQDAAGNMLLQTAENTGRYTNGGTLKGSVEGYLLKMYWNDSEQKAYTDPGELADTGPPGIYIYGISTAAPVLDDFYADSIGGGGTAYEQTPFTAGLQTLSGGVTKQGNKSLVAQIIEFAATLVPTKIAAPIPQTLTAEMGTMAAALSRQVGKYHTGVMSVVAGTCTIIVTKILASAATTAVMSAGLVKQVGKVVSGTWTGFVGSVLKRVDKILAATIDMCNAGITKLVDKVNSAANSASTFSASIIRDVGKVVSGAWNGFAGSTIKAISRVLSATTQVLDAIVDAVKNASVNVVTLTAEMATHSASIGRAVGKTLNSTMQNVAAGISRFTSVTKTAAITIFSGTVSKLVSRALSATMQVLDAVIDAVKVVGLYTVNLTAEMATHTASLIRWTNKTLSSTLQTLSATTVKHTSTLRTAAIAPFSGAVSKLTSKLLSATTQVLDAILATLKTAVSYTQSFTATLQTLSGSIVKSTNKVVSASLQTLSADIVKHISRLYSATTQQFAATLYKSTSRVFTATVALFAGLLATAKAAYLVSISAVMSVCDATIIRRTDKVLNSNPQTFAGSISRFINKAFISTLQTLSAILGFTSRFKFKLTIYAFSVTVITCVHNPITSITITEETV